MAYPDHYYREMTKSAQHRLDTARRRAEEQQRQALADMDTRGPAAA